MLSSGDDFEVAIAIEEYSGLSREQEPVRVSVPLMRGLANDTAALEIVELSGICIPHQSQVLARWPDESIKWLLLDIQTSIESRSTKKVILRRSRETEEHFESVLKIVENNRSIHVDTGAAKFVVGTSGKLTLDNVGVADVLATLTDKVGEKFEAVIDDLNIEQIGALRITIAARGRFKSGMKNLPVVFMSRMTFFAGRGNVEFEFCLRNPMAARHPGNLWDLGDKGSFFFRDLSINIQLKDDVQGIQWYPELYAVPKCDNSITWTLYQDSSGGENWNSPNHISASGQSSVQFSGYRVFTSSKSDIVAEGARATPGLSLRTEESCVAACVDDFWQNFPKALRRKENQLSIGLFPVESLLPFELQGGERKRHVVQLCFGVGSETCELRERQQPLRAVIDSSWIEQSSVIPYFVPESDERSVEYREYIHSIIDGPDSFFAKREAIDEYGWRNFGETYADHEAVNHEGPEPFVSHYNNQYDFLNATCVHFLKTGDNRWRQLMADAAQHLIDIDIYHTDRDRAAYNGGLFWHTDHYLEAGTATHRAYSCRNGSGQSYGGGPSSEQNYTTGLLNYYFLTGDIEARDAVLELANWVIAMDDGSNSMFAFIDSSDTGLASGTVSTDYHGPGRGPGNSINALLDAYTLTGNRRFLQKAENLICRCVHPHDDIGKLHLDEPEHRWSYLVFLQALGKYLESKAEYSETDHLFYYARDSLLRYAEWMLINEGPYKEVLHKVELPTETWPAQDIRKSHVMHIAAKCSNGKKREIFAEKAKFFFDHCLADLRSFETSHLARPKVLLAVYGFIHSFFVKNGYGKASNNVFARSHEFDFDRPQEFIPQRALFQKLSWDRWPITRKIMKYARRPAETPVSSLGVRKR